MHRRTIASRAAIVGIIAAALVVGAAQPASAWSSAYKAGNPPGCFNGSLVGQSWYPSAWESRATSAAEGVCPGYSIIYGQTSPTLVARLRYASGGASAGATTTTSFYVTTTGWAHYSSYLGGYHNWGGVVLNS